MLRFLFSFCGARDDATQVKPKNEELPAAFKVTRELANEPNTPLRDYLNRAWVTSATIRSYVS